MNNILFGDCRQSLRTLAQSGVKAQTCVTSPPYFGLRDYGHDGQIGLEQTPEEYIAAMVEVFRCVRDVLADDGTLWVNIGDSYNAAGRTGHGTRIGCKQGTNRASDAGADNCRPNVEGLKPKDLIGISWLLAFALRADGWYLRQDIIWHKPNPMPESVRDRCTKAHEYIFLLSKSERYFYDHEAIKEPMAASSLARLSQDLEHQTGSLRANGGVRADRPMKAVGAAMNFRREGSKRAVVHPGQNMGTHRPDRTDSTYDGMRNKRSVWTVATRPYKGAHFATFPPALIEPCILAGSRPGDVVLDPFMGSGTTAAVAIEHGRQYLGCELNETYKPLQDARIAEANETVRAAEAAAYTPQLDLFAS